MSRKLNQAAHRWTERRGRARPSRRSAGAATDTRLPSEAPQHLESNVVPRTTRGLSPYEMRYDILDGYCTERSISVR
jgi:hypothetical protein